MTNTWLARMSLALLCTGSGWSTASAQNTDAENNKLVFAVVVLALTVDDVAIQGGRVIGYVTQKGGAPSERRIIALTIDDGLVREYRSWAGVALQSAASAR